jgi:hypothetical protein
MLPPALASAQASPARYAPEFTGYWTLDRASGLVLGPNRPMPAGLARPWILFGGYITNGNTPPPLRPEALATVRALQDKELAGAVADQATVKCEAPNNIDFMSWGEPIVFLQRADALVIIPEKERSIPRTIHIGGAHPAKTTLSVNGHSIGHWEGDTLVVDIVEIDPSQPIFFGDYIPHTADLHVTEKIHLEPGGQTMAVEWLFDDPKVFTQPWRLLSRYNRAPFETEAIEAVCDVDKRGLDFETGK